MNKNIFRYFIILFLLVIVVYMITSSKETIESVTFSVSIWKDNLFPTLFPFFVISNLLMHYGFVDIIGSFFAYPMQKFFHLPKEASFVLAASLFSGFPSGAKYTKDLVAQNRITQEEGARLLTFTHYSNPLFILGMVGTILLNDTTAAFCILVSHISAGLVVGYIWNLKYNSKIPTHKEKITTKLNMSSKSFGELLSSSIFDSLNTMFLLLGIVTIFLIISSWINQLFDLPPTMKVLFSGILEMTQGVKLASSLKLAKIVKIVMITAIISFGGLSVHMQVIGIISEQKIKYKPFLLARIFHSILASIFVFIIYTIFLHII